MFKKYEGEVIGFGEDDEMMNVQTDDGLILQRWVGLDYNLLHELAQETAQVEVEEVQEGDRVEFFGDLNNPDDVCLVG